MTELVVAQTAPQLWAQLLAARATPAAIERVHDAYLLAARLHSASYRSSGKPFIDHLVGTASVVARVRLDPEVLAAALLHAAYTRGGFDDFARSTSRRRQRELVGVVGKPVEVLVRQYATEPWDLPRVHALAGATCRDDLASWVLVRVANEVDEHVDGAMRFDPKRAEVLHQPAGTAAVAHLARHYGFEPIARLLEEAAAADGSAPYPEGLVGGAGASRVVLPPFARPTMKRRLRSRAARFRRGSA